MTNDLSTFVTRIYSTKSLELKKQIACEMIDASYAKKETKIKALRDIQKLYSPSRIDSFATNYMLSGEGLKVA